MSRAQFTVGCLQGRGLTDRDGDLLATRLTTSLVENCGIDVRNDSKRITNFTNVFVGDTIVI